MDARLKVNREEGAAPVRGGDWCRPVRVHAVIQPGSGAGPDAAGCRLHPRWRLPAHRELVARDEGWNRHATLEDSEAWTFETDDGVVWLPAGGGVEFVGGLGTWTVEIWTQIDEVGPPTPQVLWLTRAQPGMVPVVVAPRHTRFRRVAGIMLVGGLAPEPGAVIGAAWADATLVDGVVQTGLIL